MQSDRPNEDEMYCYNCGALIKRRDEYCVKCGVKVSQRPVGSDTVFSEKSRLAAGLLGIFLGFLGVHRFYLGNTVIGIIQILVTFLTGLLGGLWGFIEGIIIIAGANWKDAQGRPLRKYKPKEERTTIIPDANEPLQQKLNNLNEEQDKEGVNLQISVIPKTSSGWLSFGLAILFLLTIIFLLISSSVADNPSGELFGHTFANISNMVFHFSLLGALVTGLISVIVKRELSLLVLAFMIICIAIVIFLVMIADGDFS